MAPKLQIFLTLVLGGRGVAGGGCGVDFTVDDVFILGSGSFLTMQLIGRFVFNATKEAK